MPNIGSLLKDEIARLSRKEIRRQVGPLRKIAWHSRLEIAALKRRLAEADRSLALLSKQASRQPVAAASVPDGKQVRFVAKGLRSLRSRLGLSAEGLAKLAGVSAQSVYNWETKKAVPRKEQMAAIVSLRALGKREVQARLDGLAKPAAAKKAPAKKAARKKAAPKRAARKK
jgi:DNA-binding transcriptional regulator YiaG